MKAVWYENFSIIEALLQAKADANIKNHRLNTAVHFAFEKNNNGIVELLMEYGGSESVCQSVSQPVSGWLVGSFVRSFVRSLVGWLVGWLRCRRLLVGCWLHQAMSRRERRPSLAVTAELVLTVVRIAIGVCQRAESTPTAKQQQRLSTKDRDRKKAKTFEPHHTRKHETRMRSAAVVAAVVAVLATSFCSDGAAAAKLASERTIPEMNALAEALESMQPHDIDRRTWC